MNQKLYCVIEGEMIPERYEIPKGIFSTLENAENFIYSIKDKTSWNIFEFTIDQELPHPYGASIIIKMAPNIDFLFPKKYYGFYVWDEQAKMDMEAKKK